MPFVQEQRLVKISPDDFTDLLTDLDLIVTNYDVATPRLAGDVNNDGVLNILDIVLIVQHILGQGELTENQILAGDINESGGLNVLDIVELADRVLNQ